jgi:hypothetical protein
MLDRQFSLSRLLMTPHRQDNRLYLPQLLWSNTQLRSIERCQKVAFVLLNLLASDSAYCKLIILRFLGGCLHNNSPLQALT